MTKTDLQAIADLIAKDSLVEAVRVVDDSPQLMITPVTRDRRSTHRLQGVLFRALRRYGAEGEIEVAAIQRPPVIKKRVYISERRPRDPRFSHYAHHEWAVQLNDAKITHRLLSSRHMDPFAKKRHIAA